MTVSLAPEYVDGEAITPEFLTESLMSQVPLLIAFHILALVSAMLLVVFVTGLQRRLRSALPQDSLVPTVALSGILLVVVAQVLGSGLDTEFLFGAGDPSVTLPSDIGLYSHWIATIPWLWIGAGIAAVAVAVARRARAVSAWFGVVSGILGALTVLIAASPLQYLAAVPGMLWVLIASIVFAVESHR